MTTYTNGGYAIMTPGDPATNNAWGTVLNSNITQMDVTINGFLPLSVAGAANVVLTYANGAPDQERNARFQFTGVLTGNIFVLFPASRTRKFSAVNNTTGAFTLGVGVNNGSGAPAGTTVTIPQGGSAEMFSDGTNVTQTVTAGSIGAFLIANNLSEGTPVTMRTNLGLGSAAVNNIGTSGATVPLLNGNNTYGGTAAFGSTVNITGATTFQSSVAPNANVTLNCGSSANSWNNVFANTYNANNGSGSVGSVIDVTASTVRFSDGAPWQTAKFFTNGVSSMTITSTGAVSFDQYTAGGLQTDGSGNITAGQISVANGGTGSNTAAGARTNLGLGTAATQNVGTFFQVANNLSEGTPATMRTNLGLGSIATVNVASSGQIALPGNGSSIALFNHNLGGAPSWFNVVLICQTAEGGWASGDVVQLPGNAADGSHGFQPFGNATQIGGIEGSSGIYILNKSSGGSFGPITTANWKMIVFGFR